VNDSLSDWPSPDGPRRAGVSSLGIGGTNAHAVLEQAPEPPAPGPSRASHLLVLSANTADALEAATHRAARALRDGEPESLADMAYTWQVGRRIWPHRRVLVARDPREAADALESRLPRVASRVCEARERPVAFLFSGQGAQYPGMGAGLYRSEPTFRAQVDLCAEILDGALGRDLREVLFGEETAAGEAELAQTALAQPALFTVEYALARLWMEWGAVPRAMLGHSIGEYVAACLAGVLTLEDALRLVAARGRLMQELPAGSMLAVSAPPAEVEALLEAPLALAAVNGPSLCAVAGPAGPVEALHRELAGRGIAARPLHTSHAFHSPAVEQVLDTFLREVRRVALRPGSIPYLSNVTGTWQTSDGATEPEYWPRHMRRTVLFGPALELLLREPDLALLEVGPGESLATLARRHPEHRPEQTVVASMRHPRTRAADTDVALGALGLLWLAGVPVDWQGFHRHWSRRRVPLPTYPFERRRYWVERGGPALAAPVPAGPMERGSGVADWLYVPEWARSDHGREWAADGDRLEPGRWLVLADGLGCGDEVARALRAKGEEVVIAHRGAGREPGSDREIALDPLDPAQVERLVADLAATGELPDRVVHLWSLGVSEASAAADPEAAGLHAFLSLVGAQGRRSASHPFDLVVVTDGAVAVSGAEALAPGKASLIGPCKVIPQEYPDIRCRVVDVSAPPADSAARGLLAERLLAELWRGDGAPVVALRGAFRWTQAFRRLRLAEGVEPRPALRDGGVYLITGGLGQVGRALAGDLAARRGAKLVLLGRSTLPSREEWEARLEDGEEAAQPLRDKLAALLALERAGAEVQALTCDVGDPEDLRAAFAEARARFGTI
ncbi:MAG TPA: type I polyketide synthase, partial [Thermoanaerobaculia bacterium]|nr:type I polyketide synthase [Thermoanaerobaculia bacterium]